MKQEGDEVHIPNTESLLERRTQTSEQCHRQRLTTSSQATQAKWESNNSHARMASVHGHYSEDGLVIKWDPVETDSPEKESSVNYEIIGSSHPEGEEVYKTYTSKTSHVFKLKPENKDYVFTVTALTMGDRQLGQPQVSEVIPGMQRKDTPDSPQEQSDVKAVHEGGGDDKERLVPETDRQSENRIGGDPEREQQNKLEDMNVDGAE